MTSDGDVDLMTAYHVVEDARRIHAAFPTLGRERFEATLRGCCPEIDVAVVRVSKDALHAGGIHLDKVFACIRALPFGDSDHVEADQTVIIVGFPQGQHSTKVAKGVVSGREFDLFQVDAPVNPGNSGGPMLDARGKHVLGIVVARHTSDEVSEGIGFVRPARQVVVRLDELLLLSLTDNVEHNANRCGWPVWLPAMNASFSPETTRALLRSACSAVVHHGTVVTHVIANSPLHRVGMRSGDVLLALALADRPDDWLEVGHHFEVRFPWWHEPLPIGTLLARMKLGDRFRVAWCETRLRHVAQERETKRHKSTASVLAPSRFEVQYADVVLDQPNRWPLRERFPRFNAPDYEAFAGVVVVPLTANLCNENDKCVCLRAHARARASQRTTTNAQLCCTGTLADVSPTCAATSCKARKNVWSWRQLCRAQSCRLATLFRCRTSWSPSTTIRCAPLTSIGARCVTPVAKVTSGGRHPTVWSRV